MMYMYICTLLYMYVDARPRPYLVVAVKGLLGSSDVYQLVSLHP